MQRKVRGKSRTGTYHVMLRGINGENIFKLKHSILSIRQIERLTGISSGIIRDSQHKRTVPMREFLDFYT